MQNIISCFNFNIFLLLFHIYSYSCWFWGEKWSLWDSNQMMKDNPVFYFILYIFNQTDLFMTVVHLFSAADVHRPGPAGPKLWWDRSRQRRGRRSGVLAGRGDDQRREQPKRSRLPVRRGQSHRQRGPPLTTARENDKDPITRPSSAHVCLPPSNAVNRLQTSAP